MWTAERFTSTRIRFLSESLPIKAEMETWVQVIWESTSERMSGGAGRGEEARESSAEVPAELTPQTSSFQSPGKEACLLKLTNLRTGSNIRPRTSQCIFGIAPGLLSFTTSLLLGQLLRGRPAQSPSSEKVLDSIVQHTELHSRVAAWMGEAFEG